MQSNWIIEPNYTEFDFAQVWRGQTGWKFIAICCVLGYAVGLFFSIFLLLAVNELLVSIHASWWRTEWGRPDRPLVHLLAAPWLVYSWSVAFKSRQETGAKLFNDYRAKFDNVRFEVSFAGLRMSDGEKEHLTAWNEMKRFVEFRDWFLLFRRKDNAVYIIPKRCFESPTSMAEFSRFIESRMSGNG